MLGHISLGCILDLGDEHILIYFDIICILKRKCNLFRQRENSSSGDIVRKGTDRNDLVWEGVRDESERVAGWL